MCVCLICIENVRLFLLIYIGGVFEKRHMSVQEGSESIYLKPGRVSGLKFECPSAGIDGFADTPVSGSRHGK